MDMRITYDRSVDAAYIYFVPSIILGDVKKTYSCNPIEVNGQINLDFNESGRLIGILIGIEVLGASQKLPADLLSHAEIIG